MKIKVKVKTNSRKNAIKPLAEDTYEIRVKAAPEKDKANEETREVIARYFNVPKSRINIVRGEFFKEKIIEIKGI